MTQRILLTGASGFLGRAIVKHARELDVELRCTGRSPHAPANVTNYVSADLTKEDEATAAVKDCDVLIHSAGLAHQFGSKGNAASEFQRVNVVGTQNTVRAAVAAGVRHIVLVSSVSVYGQTNAELVSESTPCQPEGPYASSKFYAEVAASQLTEPAGIPLTILRMATIYGEGDPGNVARLMDAIDRRRFVWIGSGKNLKSLVHVDDAATACCQAAMNPAPEMSRAYNISAEPCRMREVVSCISAALEKSVLPVRIPAAVPIKVAGLASRVTTAGSLPHRLQRTLKKWIANDAYDGAKFCKDFNFSPSVALEEGIAREAKWFQKRAA